MPFSVSITCKTSPLSTRSLVKISFGNRTPAELPTDLIVSAVIEFHPILQNCITNVITQLIGKIKCKCLKITCPNPGPYRNPQAPGLGRISIHAERPKLAAACLRSGGPVHPPHAQVPRHSPDTHRPLCAHGRDALAPGPAAASAGGQRQNCPLHCLRRTRLPAGPHGPLWPDAGLHWRERVRRRKQPQQAP